jgi:hypothetical protein
VPNRIIRESALTSATLYRLGDGAERLFWRLTLVADDFGRFEAEPQVLKARCFPRWPDRRMPPHRVANFYAELESADLVRSYVIGGAAFGHFVTWDKYQQRRAKTSKYPAPTPESMMALANICAQMPADANKCAREARSEKREARSEESEPTASASARQHTHADAITFRVPAAILAALDQSPRLGTVATLRQPTYWQAIVRAYPGVDYPAIVLDAESYLTTRTKRRYTDLATFLRNSIKRECVPS